MADTLTPGPHHRESEFRVPGEFGTCGPNALAMAAWNASGRETHTEDVYQLMRAHGLCDPSGASTPGGLRDAAALLGLSVVEFVGYGGDDWPGWRSFLDRHAGSAAVVLELSNGQALHDENLGRGENATNLRYHYICGYGPQGDGWAFADGDNWAAGDVLQRYSFATLAAAMPCAAIAIGVNMAWHRQPDKSGKDDQGHTCGEGMMNEIEAHGGADGLMSETYYAAHASFLPLSDGSVLTWDSTYGVTHNGAAALVNVWQQRQDADAQLSDARAQLVILKQQLAAAQAADDPDASAAIKAIRRALMTTPA